MFGPIVDSVAARARRSPLGMAGVAGGALLIATLVASTSLLPADAVARSAEVGAVPIVSVALVTDDAVVAQTDPQADVVDHGQEPVDLVAVTVDDGDETIRLVPRPGAVDVVDVGYPSDVDGVAVSENGAQTPANTAGFEVAAERVFASTDLRDYVIADDPDRDGSGWGHDLDVVFDRPLTGDHYLVVRERNGNSKLLLTLLDESALPFAASRPVAVEPPYGWNTGYAPGDTNPAQPVHLVVFNVAELLAATAADGIEPPAAINGIRLETNDGADVNVNVFVDESSDAATAEPAQSIDSSDGEAQDALAAAVPVGPSSVAALGRVYGGHDDGASCATAPTYIEATPGNALTYCVTVTNTGVTSLADLAVAAPTLPTDFVMATAGTAPLAPDGTAPLAPGSTATYFAEATPPADGADGEIDETYVVTATVSATATVASVDASLDGGVTPTIRSEPVSASTDIVAFPPEGEDAIAPDVAVSATSNEDSCASDAASQSDDEPVTRCVAVTNTGNTHLDSIELTAPASDRTPTAVDADAEPLAPGETAVFAVEASPSPNQSASTDELLVTANAVDSSGADLVGVGDVSATTASAEQPTAGAQLPTPAPAPATTPVPAPAEPGTAGAQAVPAAEQSRSGAGSPPAVAAQMGSDATGSTGSGSADPQPPTELAFTGWETWVFATTGILLMAVGYLLMYPEQADRLRALARGELGEPVRDYFEA